MCFERPGEGVAGAGGGAEACPGHLTEAAQQGCAPHAREFGVVRQLALEGACHGVPVAQALSSRTQAPPRDQVVGLALEYPLECLGGGARPMELLIVESCEFEPAGDVVGVPVEALS